MVLIDPPLPVFPPPIRRANYGSSPHYISPHVHIPTCTPPRHATDLSKSHQHGFLKAIRKAIRKVIGLSF
jgi:hypothetical protein